MFKEIRCADVKAETNGSVIYPLYPNTKIKNCCFTLN